jgi:hypothetical protein
VEVTVVPLATLAALWLSVMVTSGALTVSTKMLPISVGLAMGASFKTVTLMV